MAKKPGVTPRKEPTQERSKSTVDVILTAAAQILETVGFDSATTNRIAEKAGVSIGSLYQYFPNKESLANALAEAFVKRHVEKAEKLLRSIQDQPFNIVIDKVIGEIVDMYLSNMKMLRTIAKLLPKIDIFPFILKSRRHIIDVMAREIEKRRDEVVCDSPQFAAFIIVQSSMGVIQSMFFDESLNVSREQLTAELSKLIKGYLKI